MEKIKFKHIRYYTATFTKEGEMIPVVDNLGGATVAYTVTGNEIKFAFARCSDDDNFNKALGRTISSGRLNSVRHTQFFKGTEKEFHHAIEVSI